MFCKLKNKALLLSVLPILNSPLSLAEETQVLDQVNVEEQAEELNSQVKSINTDKRQQQVSGSTLGDYLQAQPNVDSASYGPAVGRPVVRGMSGYRVKILQNDAEVNDLSAMSQDHAVGVMPKASERIELLKGPASIIYGANAGGTVRLLEGTVYKFPKPGLKGNIALEGGTNNSLRSAQAQVTAASKNLSIGLLGSYSQTEDYTDGNGNLVSDSDVIANHNKIEAGWRYKPNAHVFVSYENLNKDYGIPNSTDAETRINMQRDSYGFNWSESAVNNTIDQLSFNVSYSDYLHDETEADSKDGLFGQKVLQGILSAEYIWGDWLGELQLSYKSNELKVCHEHEKCDEFTKASRSGVEANLGASLEAYINGTGLPYSHGHPMPDTESKTWMLGANAEKPLDAWGEDVYLSVGAFVEARRLSANPNNIQETWVVPDRLDSSFYDTETNIASSLSAGLKHPITPDIQSEFNLSYLERLPSADELYWNGFHHATDSYIFGNRDLTKERSINLDWDLLIKRQSMDWSLSAYAYRFWDYIYQDPLYDANGEQLIDPFHASGVWQTLQTDAIFAGAALRNDWRVMEWRKKPLIWSNQFELSLAQESDGDSLPRTAPHQYLTELAYNSNFWSAKLSLKYVFEASQLAENETKTDAYTLLSIYADWQPKTAYGDVSIWLKGNNLLDQYAQNHLSFLKETAPLMGRNLQLGVRWDF